MPPLNVEIMAQPPISLVKATMYEPESPPNKRRPATSSQRRHSADHAPQQKRPICRTIARTRSKAILMRQVSALGMEDPVFRTRGENGPAHPSNIFPDMGVEDVPDDMRDVVSVASDPTAVEGEGFDQTFFEKSMNTVDFSVNAVLPVNNRQSLLSPHPHLQKVAAKHNPYLENTSSTKKKGPQPGDLKGSMHTLESLQLSEVFGKADPAVQNRTMSPAPRSPKKSKATVKSPKKSKRQKSKGIKKSKQPMPAPFIVDESESFAEEDVVVRSDLIEERNDLIEKASPVRKSLPTDYTFRKPRSMREALTAVPIPGLEKKVESESKEFALKSRKEDPASPRKHRILPAITSIFPGTTGKSPSKSPRRASIAATPTQDKKNSPRRETRRATMDTVKNSPSKSPRRSTMAMAQHSPQKNPQRVVMSPSNKSPRRASIGFPGLSSNKSPRRASTGFGGIPFRKDYPKQTPSKLPQISLSESQSTIKTTTTKNKWDSFLEAGEASSSTIGTQMTGRESNLPPALLDLPSSEWDFLRGQGSSQDFEMDAFGIIPDQTRPKKARRKKKRIVKV